MTTRQYIIQNIVDTLELVAELAEVRSGKITATEVEKVAFPCAFVVPQDEIRVEPESDLIDTWEWTVIIEVWAKDTDMEELLGILHTSMQTDPVRGGYAIYSERQGADMLVVDGSQFSKAMALVYKVQYRHAKGTP